MKNLATAYTYNPTNKTITLTGLNVPLGYILLIVNATRGTIIYNLADPSLAAASYTQAASSILTLNASVSTTFHDPSDSLTIFYDDGVQTNTLLLQGPAGPQGEKGDPGSTEIENITGLQDALDGKAAEGFSESGSVEKAAMLWDTAFNDKALELRDGEVFISPQNKEPFRLAIDAAPSTHTHAIADTTGLQDALDGKAPAIHEHDISEITSGDWDAWAESIGLVTSVAGKTGAVSLEIADTTGLQAALDTKQPFPVSHSHAFNSTNQSTPYTVPTGRVLYVDISSTLLSNPAEIILPRSTDGAISGDRLRLSYRQTGHTQPLLVKQYQSTGNSQSPYTGTLLTLASLDVVTTWFEFTGFFWRAEIVSQHKSTHATGGSDALTPADIGAQWPLVVSSQNISGDTTLTSGRNRIFILIGTGATVNVDLPSTGNQEGDRLTLRSSFFSPSNFTIRRPSGTPPFTNVATFTQNNQSASFYFANGSWASLGVDLHTHAIADTTGLQAELDAKASTSALAALEARVAALEAANP